MHKKVISLIALLMFSFTLGGCVKIVKTGEEWKLTGDAQFNAGDSVEEIWESQAIPSLNEKAVELNQFLTEANGDLNSLAEQYGSYSMGTSGELSYTVKAEGTVEEVVTDKKAGYITLKLKDNDSPVVVKVQIGKIFKGSAVRDSLDFIKFEDYKNQVDYAAISQSINDLIQAEVLDKIDIEGLKGKEISVLGCFTVNTQDEILIMPVEISEK